MISFKTDSDNDKVQPTILGNHLEKIIHLNTIYFYEVDRYRNRGIGLDFESITGVDYAEVLQQKGFKRTTERLTENKAQYDKSEINYLLLRNLLNYSWKLDVRFLMHLKECVQVAAGWNQVLKAMAQEEKLIEGQPYWLRNEQLNLLNGMEPELQELLLKAELVMVKSNKIFPQCASIGTSHFVEMDSGIQPFLSEWIKIILAGYRIHEVNEEGGLFRLTEPIRTGAQQICAVVEIIRGGAKAFLLPEQALNYSTYDFGIAKEIVTDQIQFLLGHEYGHIYAMEHQISMEAKEEELYADDFAIQLMKKADTGVAPVGGEDTSRCKNDIQSDVETDRKVENIELLFLFYDMYFYASELLGYQDEEDASHPHLHLRREAIRKYYTKNKKTPLLDYAERMVKQMKEKMRQEYERN